jgi:hypothetical protein
MRQFCADCQTNSPADNWNLDCLSSITRRKIMSYTFRGSLCGRLCSECLEQLSDVTVRLYRNRKDQNVTALAVASPNDTLALLTDDQVKAKASQLIAETTTDAEGNFSFTLGREQKYEGAAFEVDVYCGTVPHRKVGRKPTPPRQFSITTLQPAWKQTGENDFAAIWNYCIPNRFWCHIRSLFDAWVICGHLTSCQDGSPIPGATVTATDVDWIQDDPLGSGVTDATGHFRIDYTSEDFMVTPLSPWINFELVGGPDVYFKATLGTDVILDEPRSKGRTPGRENIGPCFCVELCSDKVTGGCGVSCQPHWQKVWDFDIHPDAGNVGSKFSTEGYAGGAAASYVFGDMNYRQGVLLRGNCPLINPAAPANKLQYRFVIGEYTWPGTPDDPTVIPSIPPASLIPVTQIAPTTVGYVFYTDALGNPSSADVIITSADLDPVTGWVKPILGMPVTVDMHNGTTAVVIVADNIFLRTDELEVLNSAVITAKHPPKSGGLPQTDAGRALLTTEQEPIRRYMLQFEVQDVTLGATIFTDRLSSIILNNSSPILALDMEELFLNLCNPLGGVNTAHVLYTIDHPHLSSFALSISNNITVVHPSSPAPGPATVNGFLQLPSAGFPPGGFFFRGGNSGPHNGSFTGGFPVDVSADPSCAYRVDLAWSTRHYPQALNDDKAVLYCR